MFLKQYVYDKFQVSPYTGEWIEIEKQQQFHQEHTSHLTQVSGLKFLLDPCDKHIETSHLTQVSGLKLK